MCDHHPAPSPLTASSPDDAFDLPSSPAAPVAPDALPSTFVDFHREFPADTRVRASYLVQLAIAARERAYCPYSKFHVGAALLARSGKIYIGCNMENSSYGLTICAERNAFCQAIAAGERHFLALAVSTDLQDKFGTPCGACRQVISEFGGSTVILLAKPSGEYVRTTANLILPCAFTPADLDVSV